MALSEQKQKRRPEQPIRGVSLNIDEKYLNRTRRVERKRVPGDHMIRRLTIEGNDWEEAAFSCVVTRLKRHCRCGIGCHRKLRFPAPDWNSGKFPTRACRRPDQYFVTSTASSDRQDKCPAQQMGFWRDHWTKGERSRADRRRAI